jgi:hypothetical protein
MLRCIFDIHDSLRYCSGQARWSRQRQRAYVVAHMQRVRRKRACLSHEVRFHFFSYGYGGARPRRPAHAFRRPRWRRVCARRAACGISKGFGMPMPQAPAAWRAPIPACEERHAPAAGMRCANGSAPVAAGSARRSREHADPSSPAMGEEPIIAPKRA